MSNRRKSGFGNAYRTGFLRSPAWHDRRDRWFTHRAQSRNPLICLGCGRDATPRQLELHHLSYAGVIRREGRWVAAEDDRDLIPLHPYCHELLHRLLDRDAILSQHRDRLHASVLALAGLRRAVGGSRHD